MKSLAIILSPILFGGCVLGPEPGNPDIALPGAIRSDSAPHGESFGDKAWRKVFTDATLCKLIERTIANNPDLAAATYRIEQARAQATAANSDWFPQLNGSAGGIGNYGSANAVQVMPGAGRSSESYNLTGLLSWELDLWGGIHRSNQSARSELLAANYQRAAVQTSLVAAVAASYIELKNLDERLSISRRTVRSRRESLDLVKARGEGGIVSELETGQAEALLGQALTAIPITEKAITEKENEIRFLLGEYPSRIVRGGSFESFEDSLHVKGGLPSSLLSRRPDLAAANQSYQAAVAQIGVADALRLPNISLTGTGGMISSDFGKLLESNSTAYSIGPSMSGPIFDAGRSKARADAARARAGEALVNYNKASQQAFREAADAINAHIKMGEITTQLSALVKSYQKVAMVATDRFQGGASGYLEVLDAERSLFSAELELADARRDRLLAVVFAYRALGGGWQ